MKPWQWTLLGLVLGMAISGASAQAGSDNAELRGIERNTGRIAAALEKGCK